MSSRSIRQFLEALHSAGIRYLPHVDPPAPPAARPTMIRNAARKAPPVTQRAASPAPSPAANFSKTVQPSEKHSEITAVLASAPTTAEDKGQSLQQIAAIVSKCERCSELAMNRRQTVFGTGNPDAKIMFIGEAPGADEDKQGEPFVGAAGQLLDKIIKACGLNREDLYICNILRCRPPGNRNPLPQEAGNCREYLDAQIAIVKPEYIVCWGSIAAQNLLSEQRSVGKLRGTWLQHGEAKVLCTYHPSYLLRYPQQKKEVWGDMKLLMADMGVEL